MTTIIKGTIGNDVLGDWYLSDDALIIGKAGNDSLIGGFGDNNTLLGGAGDDIIECNYGNNSIHGGDGDDLLFGSYGDDKILGDSGDDSIASYGGNDTLNGGRGNDTIESGTYDGEHAVLAGGEGDDVISHTGGGTSTLSGGQGNDTLIGYDNDHLSGGAGNDRVGAGGHSILTGGAGSDVFDFYRAEEGGLLDARVTDFHATQDTLDLSHLLEYIDMNGDGTEELRYVTSADQLSVHGNYLIANIDGYIESIWGVGNQITANGGIDKMIATDHLLLHS